MGSPRMVSRRLVKPRYLHSVIGDEDEFVDLVAEMADKSVHLLVEVAKSIRIVRVEVPCDIKRVDMYPNETVMCGCPDQYLPVRTPRPSTNVGVCPLGCAVCHLPVIEQSGLAGESRPLDECVKACSESVVGTDGVVSCPMSKSNSPSAVRALEGGFDAPRLMPSSHPNSPTLHSAPC